MAFCSGRRLAFRTGLLLLYDAHRFGDFLGSDALPDLFHLLHDLLKAKAFRRAYPLQVQPFGTESHLFHLLPDAFDAPLRPLVRVHIVAVADVTARYQYHGSPFGKCAPDELLVHPSGAHGSDQAGVGRIVEPRDTGKIGARIGAPVAREDRYSLGGIYFEDGVNLGLDLRVRKMIHRNGHGGAFGSACAAPRTGRFGDFRRRLCLCVHADGIVRAHLCTQAAGVA